MAQNKVYAIIGARGKGKTPFIMGGEFEEGLAKIFFKKNMSTLIIDEIDHPKYRHVPILKPKDYGKLSTDIGIYRTLCPLQHMQGLVEQIAEKKLVWNSLLVLEDSGKYISKTIGQTEKTLIGNSKQQNVDVVFMNWSWSQVPPTLFDFINELVIFPTGDGPECRYEKITACYEQCMEAHKLVCAGTEPYVIVPTGL